MTRCILLVAVATKQFVSNLPFHHSSCLSIPRSTWINISVYMLYTCIYRLYIFSCFFCKEILSYSVPANIYLNDKTSSHLSICFLHYWLSQFVELSWNVHREVSWKCFHLDLTSLIASVLIFGGINFRNLSSCRYHDAVSTT